MKIAVKCPHCKKHFRPNPRLKCGKCGHQWRPRQDDISICPRCKTKYWE